MGLGVSACSIMFANHASCILSLSSLRFLYHPYMPLLIFNLLVKQKNRAKCKNAINFFILVLTHIPFKSRGRNIIVLMGWEFVYHWFVCRPQLEPTTQQSWVAVLLLLLPLPPYLPLSQLPAPNLLRRWRWVSQILYLHTSLSRSVYFNAVVFKTGNWTAQVIDYN